MKATINKNDVLPVLSKIQGLAGRKTNLAITTNILIQTEESGISIAATDLETGFKGFYLFSHIIPIESSRVMIEVKDLEEEILKSSSPDSVWEQA